MAASPILRRLIVSAFETNCWLVGDPETLDTLVIDPGDFAENIIEAVRADGLKPLAIVNTHGHADHMAANGRLKEEFGCPIMVHEADAHYLTDPNLNLSALFGEFEPVSPPADKLLGDGDDIRIGGLTLKVIHTRGHTPGGICLLLDNMLFAGDTLFAGSVGRTDFPNGSHEELMRSIHERLLCLPDNTAVYPGHGPATTIGEERASNPFL